MIKISHEVPVCLLNRSKQFNDYDYCLVHLTDENQEYNKYYNENNNRTLLDNSIFELGIAFDIDKFIQKIKTIKPKEYIVPDVLDDGKKTVENFKIFNKLANKIDGIKIGVLQGKTYDEIIECYQFLSENADKIAISFNMQYFLGRGEGNTLEKFSTERSKLIQKLQNDGIWNFHKPHHLLGCALYKEFRENKDFYINSSIESLDTSNPVVAGIYKLRYNGLEGLEVKPTIKLYELIDSELTQEQIDIILYNVEKFREGLEK